MPSNISKSRLFYILATAIFSVVILAFSFFSEVSDILNGVGSDGIYYARFTPDLIEQLKNKAVMAQIIDRLLPLAIAHFFYDWFFRAGDSMMVFSQNGDSLHLSKNIVQAYKYLNTIYLLFAVILWARINYKFGITRRLFLLSLFLLFFNFMFLKQFFFEPVFLDQFVFFYSIVLLNAVLFKQKWLFPILLIFSFFINKLVILIAIFLILLKDEPIDTYVLKLKRNYLLFVWIVGYISVSFYVIYNPLCTELIRNKTMYNLIALSIAATLVYTLYFWLKAIPEAIQLNISKSVINYLAIVVGGVLHFTGVKLFAGEFVPMCENMEQSFLNEIFNFIRNANSRPLGFLSSHYNYFGLVILVLILFVSRIKKFLNVYPGWVLLFLCFLGLSYNSESRHLTFLMPFITWMIIIAPDCDNSIFNNKWFLAVIGIANLLWSGFYLNINPLGTWEYYTTEDVINENLFKFPLQKYFKHFGTTTNNESYYFQLLIFAICLITGLFLILYLKNKLYLNSSNEDRN